MGSQSGKTVSGWNCINTTTVYDIDDYAQYLEEKKAYDEEVAEFYNTDTVEGIENIELQKDPPSPPEVNEPLKGLRIMKCDVKEHSELNKVPVESGYRVSDNKVRWGRRITITGICDNLRGELKTTKDTRSKVDTGIPIIGGAINNVVNNVVDTVMGYEFETKQEILTTARRVFQKIDAMYRDIEIHEDFTEPKLYTISTKGMIYGNMILVDVEQLTDAEHLLTIPVSLVFEELIIVGKESAFPADDQDAPMSMGGSLKKGNMIEETWEGIKTMFD